MNRQEYNKKIRDYLLNNKEFNHKLDSIMKKEDVTWENSEFYEFLDELIKQFPQQRFGQLFCNYIGGDYRSPNPNELTTWLQEYLFAPGNYDPFYEESKYTYYRLTREIPEVYKKTLEELKGKKVYYADGDNTKVGTLKSLFMDSFGDWCWIIDENKVSTSKSITML